MALKAGLARARSTASAAPAAQSPRLMASAMGLVQQVIYQDFVLQYAEVGLVRAGSWNTQRGGAPR